ncbi:MAG: radical SAM protein [Candidatus Riflebacteria bacterium]|nr:radical SAM protein [Candidatus Riflebacteria bacterium]
MQIARVEERTSVEGPGLRTAIWLQGCSISCQDCCNPEMHDPNAGESMTAAELADAIIHARADGLTLLGGEPLDQAAEVRELLLILRSIGYRGVILFSGYTWEQIAADPIKAEVAQLSDLVIAGPFDKSRAPGVRRWIGSDNQTLHFQTDYYRLLAENWPPFVKEIEIVIGDGDILVNGTPLGVDDELAGLLIQKGESGQ